MEIFLNIEEIIVPNSGIAICLAISKLARQSLLAYGEAGRLAPALYPLWQFY
jgi:hypothetical protein